MQRTRDEPYFELDVRTDRGGRTTVVAAGEIDMTTAGELRDALAEHLAAGEVLLDLREVTFMDSSGVAALDRALRSAGEDGGQLRLCDGLHANVRQILELTGMLGVLKLEPCEEEA